MTVENIKKELESRKNRSAWEKGVNEYALELIENIDDNETPTEEMLLDGARTWSQFSWGGCSLIYNEDIAERLCCPSELKRTRNGERKPNSREEWLDTQARALNQACKRVLTLARKEA